MKIKIVKTSSLAENCYILEHDKKCLIIDPGAEFKLIDEAIEYEVLGVLITHRHFDHIGAVDELVSKYKCNVYEFNNLEERNYIIGPFSFNVIFNPGHSEDSISFYFKKEKKLFSGDFVFEGNIGRCDLPGGDYEEMMDSISMIKKYPDDTIIYPGHGEFTSIGHEKLNNYYFNI